MLEVSGIGVVTAFVAGIISFLSPCVLPLVPGYLSYVAGNSAGAGEEGGGRSRLHMIGLSLCFVLGFSAVFVALGASATLLGRVLLAYRYETNIIGGAIIIIFGLFMTGLIKLPWLEHDVRYHGAVKGRGPGTAFVLGVAFAFGWTPCIGPVLGAILTVSAVSPGVSSGTALLAVYALGLGVPFVLAATFTGEFVARMGRLRRLGRPLQIVAGGLMILMGVAMITGWLSRFAYWMLEAFPVLAEIG